jgi:hypothetical protein
MLRIVDPGESTAVGWRLDALNPRLERICANKPARCIAVLSARAGARVLSDAGAPMVAPIADRSEARGIGAGVPAERSRGR